MASVFLVGSFFYSLLFLFVLRNSLSEIRAFQISRKFIESHELSLAPIKTIFAQELYTPDTNSELEAKICQEVPTNLSISSPEIEMLKNQQLCTNFSPETFFNLPDEVEEETGGNPALKEKLTEILKGKPMEAMIDPISKQDKTVAAFLVGIALKESKFGVYAPHKNGADCYNYWGYRGKENSTASGYSCFASPEEAVSIVGGRIKKLVDKDITTPSQMVVWKCGSSCHGHAPGSVEKWIKDVSIYFNQLNNS